VVIVWIVVNSSNHDGNNNCNYSKSGNNMIIIVILAIIVIIIVVIAVVRMNNMNSNHEGRLHLLCAPMSLAWIAMTMNCPLNWFRNVKIWPYYHIITIMIHITILYDHMVISELVQFLGEQIAERWLTAMLGLLNSGRKCRNAWDASMSSEGKKVVMIIQYYYSGW
jgi:membrane-associated HD superfamily phosphohydrolase